MKLIVDLFSWRINLIELDELNFMGENEKTKRENMAEINLNAYIYMLYILNMVSKKMKIFA